MNDTLDSLFHSDAECASFLNDLPQVRAEGKAALVRLLDSAYRDDVDAPHVAAFLLSLYDGQRFTTQLQDLQSLAMETVADCMLVLSLTLVPDTLLHETIEGGQVVFEKLVLHWNLGAPGGHA